MNHQQDRVVKDLNSWINRSAGQHQRRVSEGSASARRICNLQTDEEAANLKMWQASDMLPHVDYSKVGRRDGASVGACRTDLPIEYAGHEPTFYNEVEQLKREGQAAFVIVMMILALAVIAFYSFTA